MPQKTIKTNKFNKAADTKLIYRNLLCFYTLTKTIRKRIFKKSYFQLHQKNKRPSNKSNQGIKDLYLENYKMWKEIEDNTNDKIYCVRG